MSFLKFLDKASFSQLKETSLKTTKEKQVVYNYNNNSTESNSINNQISSRNSNMRPTSRSKHNITFSFKEKFLLLNKINSKSKFEQYLKAIFIDLTRRSNNNGKGITLDTFLDYFNGGNYFIIKQLFLIFDQDKNNVLDLKEFGQGMMQLYYSSFDELLELCFFIFKDFNDNEETIKSSNVKIMMYHIFSEHYETLPVEFALICEEEIKNLLKEVGIITTTKSRSTKTIFQDPKIGKANLKDIKYARKKSVIVTKESICSISNAGSPSFTKTSENSNKLVDRISNRMKETLTFYELKERTLNCSSKLFFSVVCYFYFKKPFKDFAINSLPEVNIFYKTLSNKPCNNNNNIKMREDNINKYKQNATSFNSVQNSKSKNLTTNDENSKENKFKLDEIIMNNNNTIDNLENNYNNIKDNDNAIKDKIIRTRNKKMFSLLDREGIIPFSINTKEKLENKKQESVKKANQNNKKYNVQRSIASIDDKFYDKILFTTSSNTTRINNGKEVHNVNLPLVINPFLSHIKGKSSLINNSNNQFRNLSIQLEKNGLFLSNNVDIYTCRPNNLKNSYNFKSKTSSPIKSNNESSQRSSPKKEKDFNNLDNIHIVDEKKENDKEIIRGIASPLNKVNFSLKLEKDSSSKDNFDNRIVKKLMTSTFKLPKVEGNLNNMGKNDENEDVILCLPIRNKSSLFTPIYHVLELEQDLREVEEINTQIQEAKYLEKMLESEKNPEKAKINNNRLSNDSNIRLSLLRNDVRRDSILNSRLIIKANELRKVNLADIGSKLFTNNGNGNSSNFANNEGLLKKASENNAGKIGKVTFNLNKFKSLKSGFSIKNEVEDKINMNRINENTNESNDKKDTIFLKRLVSNLGIFQNTGNTDNLEKGYNSSVNNLSNKQLSFIFDGLIYIKLQPYKNSNNNNYHKKTEGSHNNYNINSNTSAISIHEESNYYMNNNNTPSNNKKLNKQIIYDQIYQCNNLNDNEEQLFLTSSSTETICRRMQISKHEIIFLKKSLDENFMDFDSTNNLNSQLDSYTNMKYNQFKDIDKIFSNFNFRLYKIEIDEYNFEYKVRIFSNKYLFNGKRKQNININMSTTTNKSDSISMTNNNTSNKSNKNNNQDNIKQNRKPTIFNYIKNNNNTIVEAQETNNLELNPVKLSHNNAGLNENAEHLDYIDINFFFANKKNNPVLDSLIKRKMLKSKLNSLIIDGFQIYKVLSDSISTNSFSSNIVLQKIINLRNADKKKTVNLTKKDYLNYNSNLDELINKLSSKYLVEVNQKDNKKGNTTQITATANNSTSVVKSLQQPILNKGNSKVEFNLASSKSFLSPEKPNRKFNKQISSTIRVSNAYLKTNLQNIVNKGSQAMNETELLYFTKQINKAKLTEDDSLQIKKTITILKLVSCHSNFMNLIKLIETDYYYYFIYDYYENNLLNYWFSEFENMKKQVREFNTTYNTLFYLNHTADRIVSPNKLNRNSLKSLNNDPSKIFKRLDNFEKKVQRNSVKPDFLIAIPEGKEFSTPNNRSEHSSNNFNSGMKQDHTKQKVNYSKDRDNVKEAIFSYEEKVKIIIYQIIDALCYLRSLGICYRSLDLSKIKYTYKKDSINSNCNKNNNNSNNDNENEEENEGRLSFSSKNSNTANIHKEDEGKENKENKSEEEQGRINIILTSFKFSEFILSNDCAVKTFQDNINFLSPEEILNKKCCEETDVWYIGTLVYYMFTGFSHVDDENLIVNVFKNHSVSNSSSTQGNIYFNSSNYVTKNTNDMGMMEGNGYKEGNESDKSLAFFIKKKTLTTKNSMIGKEKNTNEKDNIRNKILYKDAMFPSVVFGNYSESLTTFIKACLDKTPSKRAKLTSLKNFDWLKDVIIY